MAKEYFTAKVAETQDPAFGFYDFCVKKGLPDGSPSHGNDYTMPCACMAVATFRKPAMFAPAT